MTVGLSLPFCLFMVHAELGSVVITDLYLHAAHLHLHLSAFFDDPSAKDYCERLLALHSATTTYLEKALNLETSVGPVLSYTPYYIYQMMLAGGFTLLKLCKSFFAAHIDLEYSKSLFNRTIWAIRGISVANNDLPQRLAEVLAQMWRLGGTPTQRPATAEVDDSLQLKVRCRMSMSLVYDSVWRWREDAQTKGRNIEGMLARPVFFQRSCSDCVQPISRTRRIRSPITIRLHPLLQPSRRRPLRGLLAAIPVWRRQRLCRRVWRCQRRAAE